MKTLEDYMNDPSVVHLQMPLREVKAIRLMIHDETKDLSPDELRERHKQIKRRAEEQYGFKVVASAK